MFSVNCCFLMTLFVNVVMQIIFNFFLNGYFDFFRFFFTRVRSSVVDLSVEMNAYMTFHYYRKTGKLHAISTYYRCEDLQIIF